MAKVFTYTSYIRTTPQKVWDALTVPEFSRQYWAKENISDWTPGASYRMVDPDSGQERVIGKVLECQPPKRLMTSWADPSDLQDVSTVLYEIAELGDIVRLDVTHTDLSDEMGSRVSSGWPLVIASLKSFLETGKAIDPIAVKGPCQDAA